MRPLSYNALSVPKSKEGNSITPHKNETHDKTQLNQSYRLTIKIDLPIRITDTIVIYDSYYLIHGIVTWPLQTGTPISIINATCTALFSSFSQ